MRGLPVLPLPLPLEPEPLCAAGVEPDSDLLTMRPGRVIPLVAFDRLPLVPVPLAEAVTAEPLGAW